MNDRSFGTSTLRHLVDASTFIQCFQCIMKWEWLVAGSRHSRLNKNSQARSGRVTNGA